MLIRAVHDRLAALAQCGVELRVSMDLCTVGMTFGDVPNVALYDLCAIAVVTIADKFNRNADAAPGSEREIVVPHIPVRLQLREHILALGHVSESGYLPQGFPQEFRV
ncbi:MAG TPA: hypothetical protein PLJ46_06990 [Burkholderiaceae bacterium]|nr:hypothetical protein [Burkholderiaceae bacterium]HQZ05600.1 hypothetical protein [Burkholderiaceae bacterium]